MSCVRCETPELETFIRIGNANVMIVGCEIHLKELIRLVRIGKAADDKREINQ